MKSLSLLCLLLCACGGPAFGPGPSFQQTDPPDAAETDDGAIAAEGSPSGDGAPDARTGAETGDPPGDGGAPEADPPPPHDGGVPEASDDADAGNDATPVEASSGPCEGQPDGTNAGFGKTCCAGSAVDLTTSSNCGACGIVCQGGQTCGDIDGFAACMNCANNAQCWSGICENPNGVQASSFCSPAPSRSSCAGGVACPNGSTCVVDPYLQGVFCEYP